MTCFPPTPLLSILVTEAPCAIMGRKPSTYVLLQKAAARHPPLPPSPSIPDHCISKRSPSLSPIAGSSGNDELPQQLCAPRAWYVVKRRGAQCLGRRRWVSIGGREAGRRGCAWRPWCINELTKDIKEITLVLCLIINEVMEGTYFSSICKVF